MTMTAVAAVASAAEARAAAGEAAAAALAVTLAAALPVAMAAGRVMGAETDPQGWAAGGNSKAADETLEAAGWESSARVPSPLRALPFVSSQ